MIKLTKNIKYLMCGGVTLATLAVAMPAQAVSFISTLRDTNGISHVGTVNPLTGVYTESITNGLQLTDIALNTTNQLFGITFDQLYRLPSGNNTQQIVGNLGVTGMNGLGFDTDNNLYGTGGSGFYKINTSTGLASLINNISGFSSAGDIVFNPYTNQFLATSVTPGNSTLFSIAKNGTATAIGTGIGFTDVYGLTFEGGNLLGYTTNREQIKIDLTTGVGTFDKNLAGTSLLIGGSASTPTEVPEPSGTAGFVVLGACLLARYSIQRRKHQEAIESQPIEQI